LPQEPIMSHSRNLLSATAHRWINDGATMNPAPSASRVRGNKDARETAAGCRERATADLVRALATSTMNGRQILEKSADSWTRRADMLHRIETGIEARLAKSAPAASEIKLTSAEIAEDAAHLRL
jgi:hypothetical protein